MKTKLFLIGKKIASIVCVCASLSVSAQTVKQPSLTVLHLDSKGIVLDPIQLGSLARIEMGKINKFEVMDRYDVDMILEKNSLDIKNCYGKLCLVELGKKIGVDKILTGSVELYAQTIIVTLRLIDVEQDRTEKTHIKEFNNLQNELQAMLQITIAEMFDLPVNAILEQRLSNRFTYDNLINNPDANNLNLSGPRMGYTFYTGETARIFQAAKKEGGFDAFPAMFQFGYQFETQYLNEGNFQALFEFIPMVTGLDQGMLLPSLTIMNGLRNNVNGFEIAFGPTFFITRVAEGFYHNNIWVLSSDVFWAGNAYELNDGTQVVDPDFITRLDSRGKPKISSSFVFAFGKTFISGKLNIPVNAYVIPNKDGFRYGFSVGYNAKK